MSDLLNKLQKLSREKNQLIDSQLTAFERNILKIQAKFFDGVITALKDLSLKNGVIEVNVKNLDYILGLSERLNTVLDEAGYAGAISDYLKQSDSLIPKIKDELSLTGIKKPFAENDVEIIKLIKANSAARFDFIGRTVVNNTVDYLHQGVMGNTSYKDMVSILRENITGTDVRGGSLKRYSGTYAHDSILQYNRSLNIMAANNAEAEDFLYSGPVIKTTRPFCLARVGQVFTKDEIKAMENDAGTDVWLTGGGWNCRHVWMPVSKGFKKEIENANK